MIISVEKLKEYMTTTETDAVLEAKLQALELSIREYTHNNFQQRNIRTVCPVVAQKLFTPYPHFQEGDTIQISQSIFNDGIYTIKGIVNDMIELDKPLLDENHVLVTKVEYPADVVMGAVDIMKWKLKNEAANNGENSKKEIQSKTISRLSVTYVTDKSEEDIDEDFGVPKKHLSFLKHHKKARF